MSEVIGTIYSSRSFRYSREMNTFYADIANVPEVLRQLRVDAMDLGFGIQSSKTGKSAFYILDSLRRDSDGTVWDWTFVPTETSSIRIPTCANTKVIITNSNHGI